MKTSSTAVAQHAAPDAALHGRAATRPRKWAVAALAVQAAVFWFAVRLLPDTAVGPPAWLALDLCCAVALFFLLQRDIEVTGSAWLAVLFYSVLLSAMFLGINQALDALHGSIKPRNSLPTFLHGLELHFVLVPGIASIAVGALARHALAAVSQRRSGTASSAAE